MTLDRPQALAWTTALPLAAGQFTFLLAIQPLSGLGIWFQSEPVAVANAALAALTLATLTIRRAGRRRPGLAVLAVLAVAAWSILAAPFAVSPAGTLLGAPQTAQGVLSLLSVAAFAMGAASLRGHRGPLAVAVMAVPVGAAVLTILVHWAPHDWRPYHFPDAAAFQALFAWAAVMAWPRRTRAVTLAATLGTVLLVALSDNRAAEVALAAGAATWGLAVWWGRRPLARLFATALPVLAAVAISAAVLGIGTYDRLRELPDSVRDTLVSRGNLLRVGLGELAAHPGALAVGRGWGSFDVALAGHLVQDRTALQTAAVPDDMLYWDAAHRNDFHSHNEWLEALLSGGVPALGGTLVTLALLPFAAPRRRRPAAAAFAVSVAVLSSFWFQLPASLPAFGAALGLVTAPGGRRGSRALTVGMLAGALMLTTGAGALAYRAALGRIEFASPATGACAAPMAGWARLHAAWLMQSQWHRVSDLLEEQAPNHEITTAVDRLADMLCGADAGQSRPDGLPLMVEAAVVRADLANMAWPPSLSDRLDRILAPWEAGLVAVLAQAPKRTDLAVPYLSWLVARGHEGPMARFAANRLPPDDPVALWFSGIALLGRPDSLPAGVARMQRAIALGAERFIVIPPDLKAQVLGFR